jgi:two-component system NtrC family sensor kinase
VGAAAVVLPRALAVGVDAGWDGAGGEAPALASFSLETCSKERALDILGREDVGCLILGASLSDSDRSELIGRARGGPAGANVAVLCVGAPETNAAQLALLGQLTRCRAWAAELERAGAETQAENAALADQVRASEAAHCTKESQLVQAAKLASLGELVAGVAHEINNPLSFAISHVSTLRQGLAQALARLVSLAPEMQQDCARYEDRLAAIKLGLDRILGLVSKLSTYSRFDEGESQTVDVPGAVRTLLEILEHRTRDRVTVTTQITAPEIIECDPGLINQCVMNLVTNAIDAIDGAGSIVVAAGACADQYEIRVLDTGAGVAGAIQRRIFDPFFTTKPPGKGTGLGLSIATSLVKKHGGTLELTPREGGGTEALIRIPLARVMRQRRVVARAR